LPDFQAGMAGMGGVTLSADFGHGARLRQALSGKICTTGSISFTGMDGMATWLSASSRFSLLPQTQGKVSLVK
jgi:hypothetical protein